MPITVPRHAKPLKKGTLRAILNMIDADLDYLESTHEE